MRWTYRGLVPRRHYAKATHGARLYQVANRTRHAALFTTVPPNMKSRANHSPASSATHQLPKSKRDGVPIERLLQEVGTCALTSDVLSRTRGSGRPRHH